MKRVAPAALLAFHLNVEPAPASRPRVPRNGFGVYYGKNYTKFRKAAKPLAEAFEGSPTDKPFFALIEVVATKPKTGKLRYPRGDVDNYVKGPLDVMQEANKFWDDDNQCVGLSVFKRYAEPDEEAGVHVEWFTLE